MKSKRNHPITRERAEIFACRGMTQTDIATCLLDVSFSFCRPKSSPGGISALRRNKSGEFTHGIKHANGGMGCEISRKKSEVESFCCNPGKRSAQARLVRAAPIHTVMQNGDRWMQFAENPLIVATINCFERRGGKLQIGRRISEFIKFRIVKVAAYEVAVFDTQFVFSCCRVGSQSFPKGRFDFLKCNTSHPDQSRPGQRQFAHLTRMQDSSPRKCPDYTRRLLQNRSQAGRNPRGHERVAISPEIDPRLCIRRNFVD